MIGALALGADLGTLSQMPGMRAWGPPSPTAKNASGAGNEQRAKPSLPAKANNASVQNSPMSRVAPEQRVPAGTTHAGQAALMERSPIPDPTAGLGMGPNADDTGLEGTGGISHLCPHRGPGTAHGMCTERHSPDVALVPYRWETAAVGAEGLSREPLPQFPLCS